MASNTFSKRLRLLHRSDFRRVFDARHSVADRQLIVYALRTSQPFSRLGMAVSKKVGNAVVRNRWKRRIREAFRTQQDQLPCGLDLVVLPKRDAEPDYAAIRQSLATLTRRLDKANRRKSKP